MDSEALFPRVCGICKETWPQTIYSFFHLFDKIVLYAGVGWDKIVTLPATLNQDGKSELSQKILDRIERASDDELRALWENGHGVCTSWSILVASKITADPNDCYFGDVGHHRLAYTKCGILIDSSAREAEQLQNRVPKRCGKATFMMDGIGQGRPTLSYTVRLYPRIVKATLTRK